MKQVVIKTTIVKRNKIRFCTINFCVQSSQQFSQEKKNENSFNVED